MRKKLIGRFGILEDLLVLYNQKAYNQMLSKF